MKIFQLVGLVFFLSWNCNPCFSQTQSLLLALSKSTGSLVLYDYHTLDSIASIPVGEEPHEIVVNADGSRAYISRPEMNKRGHYISVVNLHTRQAESHIDTYPFLVPHGLVFRDGKLWFTAQGSKVVAVYNLSSHEIEQVLGTGQDFTHLLQLDDNNDRFYTSNVESGTLSIYENLQIPPYLPPTGVFPPNAKPRVEWRQTLLDLGLGVEGFDISPSRDELWAARPDGHIVIVDLKSKNIIADIDSEVLGLHRLAFTPDGKQVAIVSVRTGDLLFYDAKTRQLETQINIGRGAGIFMDKEKNRMFVSCTPDNEIVVIDLDFKQIIKKIEIGRPDGVTYSLH